jgi:hypothetical protein
MTTAGICSDGRRYDQVIAIETLPNDLLHLRQIGTALIFFGAGVYLVLRYRQGEVTSYQYFVHRFLCAVGFLIWMIADGLGGHPFMVAFEAAVLLALGHRDIRLVWVKLMAWRTARIQT